MNVHGSFVRSGAFLDVPTPPRTYEDFLRIGMGWFRAGLAEAERLNDQKAADEWQCIIDNAQTAASDLRTMIDEANTPWGDV